MTDDNVVAKVTDMILCLKIEMKMIRWSQTRVIRERKISWNRHLQNNTVR